MAERNSGADPGAELPRKPLLGTWVNKGKRKSQGILPGPSITLCRLLLRSGTASRRVSDIPDREVLGSLEDCALSS